MITLDVLTARPDMPRRGELERWIARAWVRPARSGGGYVFAEIDVARVQLIHQLRAELGLGAQAVPVVLSLLDQLYTARRQLRAVAGVVQAEAPDDLRLRLSEVLARLDGPG